MSRGFFDSNVLIYAFAQGEEVKTRRALALLRGRGVVGVQSLNEFAVIARRKLAMDWDEIDRALGVIRGRCDRIVVLTEALQRDGLRLARDYQLAIYDSMLLAAALAAKCDLFWSEDMHDGMLIDGRLRIVNPFAAV